MIDCEKPRRQPIEVPFFFSPPGDFEVPFFFSRTRNKTLLFLPPAHSAPGSFTKLENLIFDHHSGGIETTSSLARTFTFGVDAMAKDQLGPAGSAAASSDSGSDECRRGLMPATLMRCVKSQ
jgi:hypothetical protein